MKYITKGIGGEGKRKWTVEEWVYHAVAWKHHHRYIGMSRSISRYCTARKLRYRYGRYLSGWVGERVNLPELPTDKDGLVEAMVRYRYLPGFASRSAADMWSCTFVHDRGTVSLIRRTGEISNKCVEWVNESIGLWVGYRDKFLRGVEGGMGGWALVSMIGMRYIQVCLNDTRFTDVEIDVGKLVVHGRWKNFRKQKRLMRRVRREGGG